ncbi:uncharacterized protein LOC129595038 [Paramacrobiotus metropolitanus]|uniref:uncharacterized protein LOC129595038 n=1 Tax=Paramacrobiotus metropolitanus TaxID=2943436 RepID=UPI0024457BBB|nr:uncharacterized protein LOC129595038 [Paramacrobiotus metropolitanus]
MAFILHFLQLVTLSLLFGAVRSESCSDDLMQECRELMANHSAAVQSVSWPVTDADVTATQQLAHDYCRAANNSAYCLFNLPVRCADDPAFLQRFTRYDFWYAAERTSVVAMTCQLPVNTLRLLRAHEHCAGRSGLFMELLGVERDLTLSSHNATSARHNVCQYLRRFTTTVNGAAKPQLTEKCGREAVEVLQDGYQQMHDAHCSM